nr:chromatin remodeling protein EBS-like [Ipomoea batatas]GMC83699.1 chromatin remodeling protein EBS-like [Ipomoea batatas]GMC87900.1 chromatin remodeling protein EBS-like [Ipomoea batatas]
MAKSRHGRRELHSYTIRGMYTMNRTVRAGDAVFMRAPETEKDPYVAIIQKIEADNRNNVNVHVRWYYRPEETKRGRQRFHGIRELMLSDHYDVQSAETIERKVTVHTFKEYTELKFISPTDLYWRFEYNAKTGACKPGRVEVFHPRCLGMSNGEANKLDTYVCENCESGKRVRKRPSQRSASQVGPKRQKT